MAFAEHFFFCKHGLQQKCYFLEHSNYFFSWMIYYIVWVLFKPQFIGVKSSFKRKPTTKNALMIQVAVEISN